MRRTPLLLMALALVATACSAAPADAAAPGPAQLIQPMTKVTQNPRQGYYSDPYPIHTVPSQSGTQTFSGTTSQLLSCAGTPTAGCFQASPMNVSIDSSLAHQAATSGSTLRNRINNNIFQDDSGAWQLAVTYYITNSHHPDATAWTVVLHARPAPGSGAGVPANWVADTLLAGSFSTPTKANYDGKYFETGGKLYLVYSKRLPGKPAHDGIVAQPMKRPDQPDGSTASVLLAPGDYNSELFHGLNQPNTFKLIETGNITEIDGKFVMAYSTGAYDEPGYKIGLAWSDTFGGPYRKIIMPDPGGIWGKPGHDEVRYLLQSQESKWPNYIAGTVVAPGVPAVIEDDHHWYLTFAGYLPAEAKPDPTTGHYKPSNRQPFFAPLSVHVGSKVAGTSDADLANWLTIGTGR